MAKLKDLNDFASTKMLAEGANPEMEVTTRTISDEVMQAAIGSFEHARKSAKYAAQLKDEILMFLEDPGASQLSSEQFAAMGFMLRQGLYNPKGKIAEIMRKRGFNTHEFLCKIYFDLTPEQ